MTAFWTRGAVVRALSKSDNPEVSGPAAMPSRPGSRRCAIRRSRPWFDAATSISALPASHQVCADSEHDAREHDARERLRGPSSTRPVLASRSDVACTRAAVPPAVTLPVSDRSTDDPRCVPNPGERLAPSAGYRFDRVLARLHRHGSTRRRSSGRRFGIAQSRESGCRAPHDRFRNPGSTPRTIAMATNQQRVHLCRSFAIASAPAGLDPADSSWADGKQRRVGRPIGFRLPQSGRSRGVQRRRRRSFFCSCDKPQLQVVRPASDCRSSGVLPIGRD